MTRIDNRRILVVDDLPSIHDDFRKILLLVETPSSELDAMEAALFGQAPKPAAVAFEVDSAYRGQQALQMVQAAMQSDRPYAMAFVDMRMPPGWDGVETIERLWEVDERLLVVICTAFSDHAWCDVLARLDARDRLLILKKPFDAIEVSQMAHTLTSKWNATRQLKHLATHDALTKLPNRVLLMDRLTQELAYAKRNGRQFMVAVVDLDRYKWVNDTLGHAAGDQLLCTMAERMSSNLRQSDTLARVGGDEFVIVLHDLGRSDDAITVLDRVVDSVSKPVVFDDGNKAAISCSVGCSSFPDDGVDAEELLRSADVAMYQAKESGGNTLQIFNAELRDRAVLRTGLENDLRHAIDRDEFVLHYQPQIDLRSGAVVGVEALLRWEHPRHGTILPGRFISIAESSGLIVPIGEWVLRRACQQARTWQDAGLPPVRMAVNLSAKQLSRLTLDDVVGACLSSAGLDPAWLELELTETSSMDDPERMIPLLRKLKDLGLSLAIDDFGTGYSNMQYLTRLPIDTLKLDGSFVRGITSEPGYLAIAEAIVAMAHRLDLRVVAEMTETEGQVALLSSLDCNMAQGYFFARPAPAERCADILRAGSVALPGRPDIGCDRRILLVLDDDIALTTAIRDVLVNHGYHVIASSRANEAFEMLARHPVNVVLADHGMPGMTGIEFLGAVRRLHPSTARLLFSGRGDLRAAIAAINQGAVHKFLQKPLRQEELLHVLAQALEQHRASRPAQV